MASIQPNDDFDAEAECKTLREALKGRKTDEAAITRVVTTNNNEQRQQIKSQYKALYGQELEKKLKSETKGSFRDIVLGLMATPASFDAKQLRSAMKGLRTDDSILIEILTPRSPEMVENIKEAYQKEYGRDLEQDVMKETSGEFKRLLVSLVSGGRNMSPEADMAKAREDAQAIYDAGEGKRFGTDETTFNMILATRSPAQLKATFTCYRLQTENDIEDVVKKETRGSLRKGYTCIVQCVKSMPAFFAWRLKDCMSGLGTDDDGIVRVFVARSEIDLMDIKRAYKELYGKSLADAIKKETKGDYRKILLACIGEGD